ncbi:MAG: hypothetical protein SVZ03_06075 [Spirochaetota bacterium]|nr:hypothetical protein [Spirochaetota bacterium]
MIVSDKEIVGIFNIETLKISERNNKYLEKVDAGDKALIVDRKNCTITSKISPYTIISRAGFDISAIDGVIMLNSIKNEL